MLNPVTKKTLGESWGAALSNPLLIPFYLALPGCRKDRIDTREEVVGALSLVGRNIKQIHTYIHIYTFASITMFITE